MTDITALLIDYSNGKPEALEALMPQVYDELKKLARSYMRKENDSHTLQPTALVHEAFFKLIDQKAVQWQNRAHFYGVAAQLMRRILIDHARNKHAAKRGGNQPALSFDEALHWNTQDNSPDILALDTALEKLSAIDERQGKVVELRYFGGLNIEETAEALKTSPATVKRDWAMARAWLFRELGLTQGQAAEQES